MQRAAFGDSAGGMTIAGGIAAALFRRERTGEPSVVDVSLLGTAMWILAPDIVCRELTDQEMPLFTAPQAPNPIVNSYRTKDGRWLFLNMLQPDRFWADLCRAPRPRRPDHRPALRERHGALQEPRGVRRASSNASSRRARSPSGATRSTPSRACGRRCRPRARSATIRRRSPTATCPRSTAATARRSRSWRARCSSTRRRPRCVPRPTAASTPRRSCSSLGFTWDDLAALKEAGAIS